MGDIVQKATTELIIDGEQAKQELLKVEDRLQEVNRLLKEAKKGDATTYSKLQKEQKELSKQAKTLRQDFVNVNQVLNNLSTAKPKELNNTIKSLYKQMASPAIKRGSKEWQNLSDKIMQCKRELATVNAEMQVGQTRMGKMSNMFTHWGSSIMASVAALTGLTIAFSKFRDLSIAQEESKADLKALTGLDTESVNWLEQQAKNMSTSVQESGVRIRQSATEILEAFKLVGSAKPELLENKEALKAVTEQAILLASASGIKLTDAVDGVTLSLNQYGAGANEAAKYVNILAAGSKFGSAAVESQTRAIKGAGVAANGANVSMEQLQGTIQTLAERGIKDEVAGTGLKKFFLTLQTGAKDTNPQVVGLATALENLSKKELSAAQIKKQFGEEGYNVAKILIDNKDKVEQYTKAVTATNVATEQAVTKSDTVAARMATANNRLNQAGQVLAEKFNPAFLTAKELAASFAESLVNFPNLFKLYWQWLALVVAVTVAYNAQSIISTALRWKNVAATKAQTIAQGALNIVMKANPLTLVITLVGTLVAAFITWYNSSIKVQAVTKALWAYIKQAFSEMAAIIKGVATIYTGFFSGINYFLQGGRSISKGLEIIKDSFTKGTEAIKDVAKNAGSRLSQSFWDTYNETMKEGNRKAVEPKVALPSGSGNKVIVNVEEDPEEVEKRRKKEEVRLKKEKERALKANEDKYRAIKTLIKQQYLEQIITEDEMNRALELMDIQSLNSRVEILKKYGDDVSSEEDKIMDRRINAMKKLEETKKTSYWMGTPEEEEADPELDKLIEKHKKSYEYKQAALEDQYKKGLLTQQEYQDQERQLQQEHLEAMLSDKMNFANAASQIAQQASQLVSTLQQREEAAIERKYAKALKAAKGNSEKTAALEEQMEEEKKQVKKKYADMDFAVTAAQIIASTSMAVMQAFAQLGPIAGAIAAAMVGATGIAQLALANEQRQQVKNMWTGGYTNSGPWDEPQGIVHSNEFVGNRYAVGNIAVNKVFRMVDIAQKNNTIATINEYDIMRSLGVKATDQRTPIIYNTQSAQSDQYVSDALGRLSTTMQELKKQLQDGTLARTYVTGDGGTKTARDKYDKMLKNVTRYSKK